jgi:hypothetical protein
MTLIGDAIEYRTVVAHDRREAALWRHCLRISL